MGSPVRSVVLDIGGVLLEWDPRLLYRALIPDPVQLDQYLGEVCTTAWNSALDAGRLEPGETLLIDDAELNVLGARGAGFVAHHFVDAATLEGVLIELRLIEPEVPPGAP